MGRVVIIKSRNTKNIFISGGEIHNRPTSSKNAKYVAFIWSIGLLIPKSRKRLSKKLLYKWAINLVGPNKKAKEFDNYYEAEEYITSQNSNMEPYFTIDI